MQQIIAEPPQISSNYDRLISYNRQRIIKNQQYRPLALNLKLATNPFLKDQEKYHFLIYKLNDYNRRVGKEQIEDQYQALMYDRLYSNLCDLPYIETKNDQIKCLEETLLWYKQQEKLLVQRKDQGFVRYQVQKDSKVDGEEEKKQDVVSQILKGDEIPSKVRSKQVLPYKKGWRTTHREIDIPARRLNDYKRKILNIAPFIQPKQDKKPPKILYPKMPRFDPKLDEPEQPQEDQKKQGEVGPNGQIVQGDQNLLQGQQNKEPQQPPEQDLGGFGQEPAQPQQQEPVQQQGEDKLAPKLKSFILQKQHLKRNKPMKSCYQYYRGEQCRPQRKMEQRYLQIYQNSIKQQKQQSVMLNLMQTWAGAKSTTQKNRQKRLQNGKFSANYTFSTQEPPKAEKLKNQQEIKYGFSATMNLRKPRATEINLNEHHLPKIGQQNLYEKSIRNDRLKSLKSKYHKLLNLPEYQQRETAASICQYTSRKRGLSQIMGNYSKSKQRLIQLDQVTRLKQRLARGKASVDIRSLSMGLCLPQQQQSIFVNQQTGDIIFPDKSLPSNPFMIETKKKKKKKK